MLVVKKVVMSAVLKAVPMVQTMEHNLETCSVLLRAHWMEMKVVMLGYPMVQTMEHKLETWKVALMDDLMEMMKVARMVPLRVAMKVVQMA